ncbi:hypothetical protein C2E23DRAFT_587613 [Lenzites betulinus]|nr:hypothetical protein C2E23DRAFT_587613 [Lenzites betulinus]
MIQPIALVASLTLAAEVLALPLHDPISSEARAADAWPYRASTSASAPYRMQERPREPRTHASASAMSDPNTTPISLVPEDDLPIPALRNQPLLLPRDDSSTPPDALGGSCQAAVGLLREDFAGHGLPLTSLVIESSSFLLLAGFVMYSLLLRRRINRGYGVHLSTFTSPWSLSPHRASTVKHTHPTPAQPSMHALSKIDEDFSLASTPTHSLFSQAASLSPLRGTPINPARSIARSASTVSTEPSLEKKSSFLSLKG